jgi:hypothetical protein
MKFSSDQVFVFLGFIAGSNVGTAVVLAFLPERAYPLGGYFIAASATLTAAVVAALMVRHQLKANYDSQRKLEKIRYISVAENRDRLMDLSKTIERLRIHLGKLVKEKADWESNKNGLVVQDTEYAIEQIRKLYLVLPPISAKYFGNLMHILFMAQTILDNEGGDATFRKECREEINELRRQLGHMLSGKLDCDIIVSD